MQLRPAWFPCLALAAIAACADPDAPTSSTTATDAALTSGSVTANLVITNDWGSGYTAEVRMVNSGTPTTAWTTVVNLGGSSLTNAWNASTTVSGSQLTASNLSYNAAIPTTLTAVWGFQGAGSGRPTLTSLSVTGGGGGSGSGRGSGSGSGSGSGGALPPPPQPSLSGSTCDNFGTIFSSGRVYFVMNNVFNDAMGSQCITANGSGFTVTTANHNT